VRRREFIVMLGAAAWPLTARAQQSSGPRRIAVLMHGLQRDPLWQQRLAAFHEELEGFGWFENRNVHIEVRYSANDYDRLP
jgi:putative tryptophan/tyrosine transport system substrate-binding protein